jgi:hypothetical protein
VILVFHYREKRTFSKLSNREREYRTVLHHELNSATGTALDFRRVPLRDFYACSEVQNFTAIAEKTQRADWPIVVFVFVA